MLDRIKAGRGRLKDLDLLLEIGDTIGIMPGTTICGLADGAAWPIKTTIRKFREELEQFIRRTNPSGYAVTEPVEALESPTGRSRMGVDDAKLNVGTLTSDPAMPNVIIDGKEIEIPSGCGSTPFRPPSAPGSRFPYYCWHPGSAGRRKLPHVSGRNRPPRRRDGQDRHESQSGARLQHPW